MANARYKRGKVYTVRSHKTPLIYVGSTIEKYLSSRLSKHKNCFKRYKNNKFHYLAVFDIFELDRDCYIELYEDYPCDSKEQLERREGQVIRELDCVNKRIAGRTDKEYREDNKEQLAAKKKEKFECECGSTLRRSAKERHFRTKKHQSFINNQ